MGSRVWMMQLGFVALALVFVFFRLLPLETVPRRWAPPELLTAFVFAWSLRRPEYVPPLLVALVLLLSDLLLQRPPGLYAALVLIGCRYVQTQSHGIRDASFVGEWTTFAIVMAGIATVYRLTLSVLAVNQAPVSLSVIELVLTIMVYPLVVMVSQSVMGVRKPAPSDAAAMGAKL